MKSLYLFFAAVLLINCSTSSSDKYTPITIEEVSSIFAANDLTITSADLFDRAADDSLSAGEWFVNAEVFVSATILDTLTTDSITVLIADFNPNNNADRATLNKLKGPTPGLELVFPDNVKAPASIGRTFKINEFRVLFSGEPSELQQKLWKLFDPQ